MDRNIKRKIKSKDNIKPVYEKIFTSWLIWLIFFTIIMMITYIFVENSLQEKQPSQNWSLAIKSLGDTPQDFRKIDYIHVGETKTITVAYVVDSGLKLQELDYLGKVKRSLDISMDSSNIRLLTIEQVADKYNIYISDRKVLYKIDVDLQSLLVMNEERISNHSEQFATMGTSIIVGDDKKTDIIIDEKVVVTYDNYEDLKKVKIKNYKGRTYASMDTIHGGDIIVLDDDNIIRRNITNTIDQEQYGYISDFYIKDDVLTILSHYFNATEPLPTLIGSWQLDSNDLEQKSFWLWNHPRTTLEPKIVEVSGDEVSYILGIQQREDESKERIQQFPVEQSGMFTNLSLYKRKASELTDYTRLTNTTEYPLGYGYIKSSKEDILIWTDKIVDKSSLMIAGKGEPWISFSKKHYEKDYPGLIKSAIMMFVTTPIWGLIFLY